jgi:hypothetical protein
VSDTCWLNNIYGEINSITEALGGHDCVAELTGRARHRVKGADGKYRFEIRACVEEVCNFNLSN